MPSLFHSEEKGQDPPESDDVRVQQKRTVSWRTVGRGRVVFLQDAVAHSHCKGNGQQFHL